MEKTAKIYVAGSTGLVWWAIVRQLHKEGFINIITQTRQELDLTDKQAVNAFYASFQPEYVIVSAARVGGIKANMTYPADFLYENLEIQNNLIWWAHLSGVTKLLFLGSSCIYPRECPQPMKEEYLMTGKPEPTNEWYAIAKIAGMRLCEYISRQFGKNFISCMPTNIYWPWDNFNPENSHVIPWLIRRMHEAKINNLEEVVIWWTWESRREFLYVDDLAEACVWLLENYVQKGFLNIWTWEDISIKELAYTIKNLVWYEWILTFDITKPDWMPKKLLDTSKINELWWRYKTNFNSWLHTTYEYFKKSSSN